MNSLNISVLLKHHLALNDEQIGLLRHARSIPFGVAGCAQVSAMARIDELLVQTLKHLPEESTHRAHPSACATGGCIS
jgi:hypothetical protein